MRWLTAQTLVLDVETTGLDVEKDRVVELGGYAFKGPDLASGQRLGTLVNPGIPIPVEASKVHGITGEMVADCPKWGLVAHRVAKRVAAAEIIVAYNAPFDLEFITAEMKRNAEAREKQGEEDPARLYSAWSHAISTKPILDPLTIVRLDDVGRYWKGKGRHKLENVAFRLSIGRRGREHRSSSDAELAAKVLYKLGRHIPDDAAEASAWLARAAEKQRKDFEAWLEKKKGEENAKAEQDR